MSNAALKTISVPFTDKALSLVEAEAKARKIEPSTLILAALADYLGRNAKLKQTARLQPLVLHIRPDLREAVIEGAKTRKQSVNLYAQYAIERRARSDLERAKALALDSDRGNVNPYRESQAA